MHLVFISSLVPVENPGSGFDIANRVVLDGLRMLGHRVSVVGYLQPGQTPATADETILLGELEVTNSRVGPATRLRWLTRALIARTTVSSAKMLDVSSARMEEILKGLQPFDGLILNSVQLPAAFEDVFQRFPYVYVAHNVEFQSALENSRMAKSRLERMLFRREAHHLEFIEMDLAKKASWVWTFAEADRFGLGYAVSDRASVLPLVTSAKEPEMSSDSVIEHDLGLIGNWSWKPNRIGLDWFLEKVTPHLPRDMTISIAGHLDNPPAVEHPGVKFVGRVPDARAFITSSLAVPLVSRAGSGVQLKTIEAFELGLPCVATRSSLRGIGKTPENCIVEDEPAAFANACARLASGARVGVVRRLDGRAFHKQQMDMLLDTMQDGLSRMGEGNRPSGFLRLVQKARTAEAAPPLVVQSITKGGSVL